MSIFDEYRRTGVKSRIAISGFIAGRGKGVSNISLDGLLPAIAGQGISIDIEGDFTAENGPQYIDAPWRNDFFGPGYFYQAKLTRQMLIGSLIGMVDNGLTAPNFKDRLELILNLKWGGQDINNTTNGYKHSRWMQDYTPSKFVWERNTFYGQNPSGSNIALGSWNFVYDENRWIPIGVDAQGYYTLDHMVGSDFFIGNYNPAIPIRFLSSIAYSLRNKPIIVTVISTAAGTPTFGQFAGGNYTPVWVRPFSVEAGKAAKILIDLTGHDSMFVSGIIPTS